MKKAILAVLVALTLAAAAGSANATDGYKVGADFSAATENDLKSIPNILSVKCGAGLLDENWGDSMTAVNNRAFLQGAASAINRDNPGSTIDCGSFAAIASGKLVTNASEYVIVSGRTLSKREWGDNGIIYDSFPGNTTKAYDQTGNFVTIKFDVVTPRASRIIDAKLPLQMNNSGAFVAGNGVSFSQIELIEEMNKHFAAISGGGHNLISYAKGMMQDAEARRYLLDFIASSKPLPAMPKTEEPKDKDAEIARLKAELTEAKKTAKKKGAKK